MPETNHLLNEAQIEAILRKHQSLQYFWKKTEHLMIFRSTPTLKDPIYEIQLAWDLGDRLLTYGWVWVEALEGKILRVFPEN